MPAERPASGGVQSLNRAFSLLEAMADAGGEMSLSELAASSGLALPTIHRLLRSLAAHGYVRQLPSRRYALGPGLVRLGETSSRMLGSWAHPHLSSLVNEVGETANLAMLEGDSVVYVAQVPSRHSMRMFTEVGRRVAVHCTGVGKALLAELRDDDVRAMLKRTGMAAVTDRTFTDVDAFLTELDVIRKRGYAVDDGEQELGVRCVAVAVRGGPSMTAISVSGPEGRITSESVTQIAPILQAAAQALADDISAPSR